MSIDNFEEPNEDDLEGLPTEFETVEFAIGVALDIEQHLLQEEDPFDQVFQIQINAGQLMNLCWYVADLYATLHDLSDEDTDELVEMIKAGKKSKTSTLLH